MKNEITHDIKLVTSIYESNNATLIKISKQNLESNKEAFDEFIKDSIKKSWSGVKDIDSEDLAELMNIDWVFLNSIYLSLFTNFENLISKLASIVEDRIQCEIKIKDIKGNGHIDQYRKYMELIGKINSAKRNQYWEQIDIFKLVRNKITHEGGHLIKKPKSKLENHPAFNFLIDNKVLLAGSLGHIRIRETFFLEKFASLTSKLCDELKQEIEKINTTNNNAYIGY